MQEARSEPLTGEVLQAGHDAYGRLHQHLDLAVIDVAVCAAMETWILRPVGAPRAKWPAETARWRGPRKRSVPSGTGC